MNQLKDVHYVAYVRQYNITFHEKRNGVLRARNKTQDNILHILIRCSISFYLHHNSKLLTVYDFLEQIVWFRMHGRVRLLLEIANF